MEKGRREMETEDGKAGWIGRQGRQSAGKVIDSGLGLTGDEKCAEAEGKVIDGCTP